MDVPADSFVDGGFTPLFNEIVRFKENEKEGIFIPRESTSPASRINSEEKELWLMHATMLSDDWVQMDLNRLSEDEILQLFIQNDPEVEKELRHMFADVNGIVEYKEASLPWLRRVKEQGCQILYLSNYSHKIMRECSEALYFLPEMDGGLFSCDVHMVKPDPAFYQALIRKYDLVPDQCVFIDDLEANLEAAGKLGMHTIRFQEQQSAEEELYRLIRA